MKRPSQTVVIWVVISTPISRVMRGIKRERKERRDSE